MRSIHWAGILLAELGRAQVEASTLCSGGCGGFTGPIYWAGIRFTGPAFFWLSLVEPVEALPASRGSTRQ